jgi:hypothetical protein
LKTAATTKSLAIVQSCVGAIKAILSLLKTGTAYFTGTKTKIKTKRN